MGRVFTGLGLICECFRQRTCHMATMITDMNVRPHLKAYALYQKLSVARAMGYAETGRLVQRYIIHTFAVGNGEYTAASSISVDL